VRGRFAATLLLILTAAQSGCNEGPGDPLNAGEGQPSSRDLRIVSLAPHLAELVYDAGAGDLLVGVTAFTDYPEAAAALPLVGDAFSLDQERLAMLEPDLLLAWKSGTAAHVVDDLEKRGYRVEAIETRGVDDVASALEEIGRLTGHEQEASDAAARFRQGIQRLAGRHQDAEEISVFYQVSARPLYTVNGDHYASELIAICGGRNVFDDLSNLAPLVDVEAVLARDPEAMLTSDDSPDDAFSVWQRWPQLAANRYDNYFFLPANEIGRATPRLLQAGESLCEALDEARRNRSSH
jgi:iron complex transport system substrate-binding protein